MTGHFVPGVGMQDRAECSKANSAAPAPGAGPSRTFSRKRHLSVSALGFQQEQSRLQKLEPERVSMCHL